MGRVFGRVHLRQHADAEFVFAHAGLDAGVVAQTLEEFLRPRGAGEVAERDDGMEGVGGLLLSSLPVAVAKRRRGLVGCICGLTTGPRGREGGELGGRWGKKDDFLRSEGAERKGIREGWFEDPKLGRYQELLVGGRDG